MRPPGRKCLEKRLGPTTAPGRFCVPRLDRWEEDLGRLAGEVIQAEVWGEALTLSPFLWVPRGKMMYCIRDLLLLRCLVSFWSVLTSDIFHQGRLYFMGRRKERENPLSCSRGSLSRELPEYCWRGSREAVSLVLLSSYSKRMYPIKGQVRIN